ncbi:hypothetical protein C8C83_2094 [Flavobacterium sp. 90]|uniref:hypothetical protein n=1 Tax=unclassified Flavobacterium TaxID=196869 RepID=UPI000EAE0032|nr:MULTISPECIES: hypothetical protein [unclassified Flavobacterium]RKR10418.1 hypothetical protein C8C82_2397 [Flavobacterium sp. 81]TCK54203.1 hypothetical protein C8C83_2094 [Flavobacterium sp. 90]
MKKVFKLTIVLLLLLCSQKSISQGIITSTDGSVNAINASSTTIPKTDLSNAMWTATNAYWATPLIYRSRRFPEDGTGIFPFNNYGELMIQGTSHGNYNKGISLLTWDGVSASAEIRMRISPNGNVGIGTITTGTHKLAVEGSIAAREIKVQATGWADFVFKKEYNLPTLQEVEKHIAEKGHLENIPSEEDVLKNGINLGEMNAKLLQKIEEMTLYMIDQNKQIIDLQKRLEKVEVHTR